MHNFGIPWRKYRRDLGRRRVRLQAVNTADRYRPDRFGTKQMTVGVDIFRIELEYLWLRHGY